MSADYFSYICVASMIAAVVGACPAIESLTAMPHVYPGGG